MNLITIFAVVGLALAIFGWVALIWLATAPYRWKKAERKRMAADERRLRTQFAQAVKSTVPVVIGGGSRGPDPRRPAA